jgi:hypothetical protein
VIQGAKQIRAAFVATLGNGVGQERGVEHFRDLLGDPEFKGLGDDEARTAWLRKRLPEEMGKDEQVRKAVCAVLTQYVEDLGLVTFQSLRHFSGVGFSA